jgi:hypothetical protein
MLLELVSIAANSAHIDIIRFSFIFSEIDCKAFRPSDPYDPGSSTTPADKF